MIKIRRRRYKPRSLTRFDLFGPVPENFGSVLRPMPSFNLPTFSILLNWWGFFMGGPIRWRSVDQSSYFSYFRKGWVFYNPVLVVALFKKSFRFLYLNFAAKSTVLPIFDIRIEQYFSSSFFSQLSERFGFAPAWRCRPGLLTNCFCSKESSKLPHLVLSLSSYARYVHYEAMYLGIPVVTIINSSMRLKLLQYHVPVNFDDIKLICRLVWLADRLSQRSKKLEWRTFFHHIVPDFFQLEDPMSYKHRIWKQAVDLFVIRIRDRVKVQKRLLMVYQFSLVVRVLKQRLRLLKIIFLQYRLANEYFRGIAVTR
jgi:hypothetical protein